MKLTRSSETPAAAGQVVSTTGAGGRGSKKWLYIGAAGGAAAGAAAVAGIALSSRNHAPTAGTASVSPSGTGLAAVTSLSFVSQGAADPDGDSLTLTWNFGDGGTATGANAVSRRSPSPAASTAPSRGSTSSRKARVSPVKP